VGGLATAAAGRIAGAPTHVKATREAAMQPSQRASGGSERRGQAGGRLAMQVRPGDHVELYYNGELCTPFGLPFSQNFNVSLQRGAEPQR
jgi:hypothetical protein